MFVESQMERCRKVKSYLALNDVALLEDLDDDILLLGAAELGLKSALGGSVEGALVAVAVHTLLAMMPLKSVMLPSNLTRRSMAG